MSEKERLIEAIRELLEDAPELCLRCVLALLREAQKDRKKA